MSEPYIAEIKIFAGNFAPRGWAFCEGQLLPIAQNTALFSLIGTIYGGDGRNDFALPDLRGRAPMHEGTGPGMGPRSLGQRAGAETASLNIAEMPSHSHAVNATNGPASQNTATDGTSLARSVGGAAYSTSAPDTDLAATALGSGGGSQPHNNVQPFIAMHFIIALEGIYPS